MFSQERHPDRAGRLSYFKDLERVPENSRLDSQELAVLHRAIGHVPRRAIVRRTAYHYPSRKREQR